MLGNIAGIRGSLAGYAGKALPGAEVTGLEAIGASMMDSMDGMDNMDVMDG